MRGLILKTSLRNLWRSRAYSALTILGFAIGIASFLLIALSVRHELSYDRYHEKADRIYHLEPEVFWGGEWRDVGMTPASYAHHMMREMPQLEAAVRIRPWGRHTLSREGGRKFVQNVVIADSSVFQAFSIPLLRGREGRVLSRPWEIAISRSVAERVFGDDDPMGQRIVRESGQAYTVVGVFEDMPDASHRRWEAMISMPTALETNLNGGDPQERWTTDFNYWTYVLLKEDANVEEFLAQAPAFFGRHIEADLVDRFKLHARPLLDMHLRGDYSRITLFSTVAVFILLIASINFMNLSTARSVTRAREIGVRKALGGSRRDLVIQFLGESVLVTLFAFLLSLLLTELMLPWFNRIAGTSLDVAYIGDPGMIGLLLLAAVVVGLLAGAWPALHISRFPAASVLKSGAGSVSGKATFRRVLVVVQFAITIAMVIATATVYRQLDFMSSKDLGFQRESMLYITLFGEEMPEKAMEFKQEALKLPGIEAATVTSRITGTISGGIWAVHTPGMPEEEALPLHAVFADGDYVETMGLELAWGRNYDDGIAEEREKAFLVNEALVERLGMDLEEDNRLWFSGVEGKIVGVLEDFNYKSLREPSDPIIFKYPRNAMYDQNYIAFRLAPGDPGPTIERLEQLWQSFDPDLDFEYRFLDAMLDRLYRREARLGELLTAFSALAIVVALLGMIGMAVFTTGRRTKEIGIRKVLGASTGSVLRLLSWDFAKPVLLANLIAWPVSWYMMHRWLQEFAYRTTMEPLLFVGAGLTVLLLAWIAVLVQAAKAASTNPVETLHYE